MSNYIVVYGIRIAQSFQPETFGRLTTIGPRFLLPAHTAFQVCVCSCGQSAIIKYSSLKSGRTRSCGCLQKIAATATGKANTTHGRTHTKEYASWTDMKTRCLNPNSARYPDYGGRGIRICGRWLDPRHGFTNFLDDIGLKPHVGYEIERDDVNGNYEPSNCRWASVKEQNRNTRRNRMLTFNGKTQCVFAWAEEYGIRPKTLWSRLHRGWDLGRALGVLSRLN